MSDTPETDALMDVWRVGKLLSVSVMLEHARKLERERDEAQEDAKRATYDAAQETIKVSTIKSHWIEAINERDRYKSDVEVITKERDEARAALQRIADCDWVITLPDRMDGVRKIAREALQRLTT